MKSMKHVKRSLLIAVFAITTTSVSVGNAQEICKVTDPTGTPLNVRSFPNGPILTVVGNNIEVFIEETTLDAKGRPWVKVSDSNHGRRRLLGWVFREFISCYER